MKYSTSDLIRDTNTVHEPQSCESQMTYVM